MAKSLGPGVSREQILHKLHESHIKTFKPIVEKIVQFREEYGPELAADFIDVTITALKKMKKTVQQVE